MCLECSRKGKEDSVAEAQYARSILADEVGEEMWLDPFSLWLLEWDGKAVESFENKSDVVRQCSSRIETEICIENSV